MPKILNQETEMVPVGRLISHPRNANQGDFGAIYESIQANGFYGSLLVQRSTRHIISGNHRFLAAQKLGYSELPVTWVDCSDEEALRILLVDNRSARLGVDNPAKLAALLTELADTEIGLTGIGYDADFLDDLLNDLARDSAPAAPPAPPPAEEETRPGVIVLCESVVEQENVYRRLSEMGWDPRKTDVTEKSVTSLAKPKK